jgi:hypothetical protein
MEPEIENVFSEGVRKLYHFTSADHALDDLRNRRLKIAQFDDLNDPFELRSVDLSGAGHAAALDQFKAETARDYGLLCFSEEWNNILLWSHYADQHRGVCLGFDVSGSSDSFGHVEYTPNRMPFPKTLDQFFMWDLLRTKFKRWEYEKEWRVFTRLEDGKWNECAGRLLYFLDFSRDLVLREVILGVGSKVLPCEVREAVRDYPDRKGIEIRRVRLSAAAFELNAMTV